MPDNAWLLILSCVLKNEQHVDTASAARQELCVTTIALITWASP